MEKHTAPVTYPTISIGGKDYVMKFGLGAMYQLEQIGIGMEQLGSEIERMTRFGMNISMVLKLSAAVLGTIDARGKWESAGFTAAGLSEALAPDWALGKDFPPILAELASKLGECMGKAAPVGNKTETTPAEAQGPVQ